MKKIDYIFMVSLTIVSITAYALMRQFLNSSALGDGTAVVLYNNTPILEIFLIDGTYNIIDEDKALYDIEDSVFIVEGTNGPVVIEYNDFKVRVIDEISPKHICQIQGWSSSPLMPITCLPNNIVILIEADKDDDDPDDITG